MFFSSKLPVGSSARIISGLNEIALAMATLCCSPPDNSDGKLFFLSGNTDNRLTEAHWNITPEEGMLYLFPSSLHHGVYPFASKQERRSVSFNIGVKPDESQGAN